MKDLEPLPGAQREEARPQRTLDPVAAVRAPDPVARILALQRTAGNAAVTRMLQRDHAAAATDQPSEVEPADEPADEPGGVIAEEEVVIDGETHTLKAVREDTGVELWVYSIPWPLLNGLLRLAPRLAPRPGLAQAWRGLHGLRRTVESLRPLGGAGERPRLLAGMRFVSGELRSLQSSTPGLRLAGLATRAGDERGSERDGPPSDATATEQQGAGTDAAASRPAPQDQPVGAEDPPASAGGPSASAVDALLQQKADAIGSGKRMAAVLAAKLDGDLPGELRERFVAMFEGLNPADPQASPWIDRDRVARIIKTASFATAMPTIKEVEGQLSGVIAELRNAERVSGSLMRGTRVHLGVKKQDVKRLGVPPLAPISEADALYQTSDGIWHIDEVKATANALVQKLGKGATQLHSLAAWAKQDPSTRQVQVVVATDRGWSALVRELEPGTPGKSRARKGIRTALTAVAAADIPLRIGDHVLTPATAKALSDAAHADFEKVRGESGPAGAAMSFDDYCAKHIPTLDQAFARLKVSPA